MVQLSSVLNLSLLLERIYQKPFTEQGLLLFYGKKRAHGGSDIGPPELKAGFAICIRCDLG